LNAERIHKHGHSRSKVYGLWKGMLQRCENPKAPAYENYGGRGISVSAEWHDFTVFLADMGFPPSGGTIDRIDNNGNYRKENCRWATVKEQRNNTRLNVSLTFDGRTQTISEWADELGFTRECLRGRIREGWSVEETLTRPLTFVSPKRK